MSRCGVGWERLFLLESKQEDLPQQAWSVAVEALASKSTGFEENCQMPVEKRDDICFFFESVNCFVVLVKMVSQEICRFLHPFRFVTVCTSDGRYKGCRADQN
jgi:hypothetical protein